MSRISGLRPVLFYSSPFKSKLPLQSLVYNLTPNNLVFLTIYFSFVYLGFDKIGPLRIDENRTPPNWQNWVLLDWQKKTLADWEKQDPSGLAKLGSSRIGKIRILPDWENWDPSELIKTGPLRIDKIGNHPDWQN